MSFPYRSGLKNKFCFTSPATLCRFIFISCGLDKKMHRATKAFDIVVQLFDDANVLLCLRLVCKRWYVRSDTWIRNWILKNRCSSLLCDGSWVYESSMIMIEPCDCPVEYPVSRVANGAFWNFEYSNFKTLFRKAKTVYQYKYTYTPDRFTLVEHKCRLARAELRSSPPQPSQRPLKKLKV